MKRLLPYLLLNVAVSAVTMLAVLLIWNASHDTPAFNNSGENVSMPSPTSTIAPTVTLPSLNQELLSVKGVIGEGDVQNEYVHVVYLGSSTLDLRDWKLLKGNKVVYTFPTFILYQGGGFNVYSRAGSDTSIDLFIGLAGSLWKNGDVVRIVDPKGNERTKFQIP